MRRRNCLILLTAAALSSLPSSGADDPGAQEPRVALRSEVVELPMHMFGNRPVVRVSINGSGPYDFILDTGAPESVIDRSLMESLDLPVVGESRLNSPAGGTPVPAKIVRIDSLDLDGMEIIGSRASAIDLASMLGGAGSPRGVLGAALLGDHLLTLDYPRRLIRVRSGELPEADGRRILAYEEVGRLPAIAIDVAGRPMRVHMDTGSPGEITLPAESIPSLPLDSAPVEVGRARLIDGDLVIRAATLEGSVGIGPLKLERPRLMFIDGPQVGNIGFGVLGRFAITIDRSNRRILLDGPTEPVAATAAAAGQKQARYGVAFRDLEGDRLEVAGVDPGSPAETAGLKSGDVIVMVNGRETASLSRAERIEALRAPSIALEVEREGKRVKLTMSLSSPG